MDEMPHSHDNPTTKMEPVRGRSRHAKEYEAITNPNLHKPRNNLMHLLRSAPISHSIEAAATAKEGRVDPHQRPAIQQISERANRKRVEVFHFWQRLEEGCGEQVMWRIMEVSNTGTFQCAYHAVRSAETCYVSQNIKKPVAFPEHLENVIGVTNHAIKSYKAGHTNILRPVHLLHIELLDHGPCGFDYMGTI